MQNCDDFPEICLDVCDHTNINSFSFHARFVLKSVTCMRVCENGIALIRLNNITVRYNVNLVRMINVNHRL